MPHPPAKFNSEAKPEEYNIFVHAFGTRIQLWIWLVGWRSVEEGYSVFINGKLRYLTVNSRSVPSWVIKETYDRSPSKKRGRSGTQTVDVLKA